MRSIRFLASCLALIGVGCGHTMTTQVGLMSFGDLEGKEIPPEVSGQFVTGKDCARIGGDPYSLSEAARKALKDTSFDTLVDVEVENTTGILVSANCIRVKGTALDSKTLDVSGGDS
jgi:hypothetical protein